MFPSEKVLGLNLVASLLPQTDHMLNLILSVKNFLTNSLHNYVKIWDKANSETCHYKINVMPTHPNTLPKRYFSNLLDGKSHSLNYTVLQK